jgi:hypothetical protein
MSTRRLLQLAGVSLYMLSIIASLFLPLSQVCTCYFLSLLNFHHSCLPRQRLLSKSQVCFLDACSYPVAYGCLAGLATKSRCIVRRITTSGSLYLPHQAGLVNLKGTSASSTSYIYYHTFLASLRTICTPFGDALLC